VGLGLITVRVVGCAPSYAVLPNGGEGFLPQMLPPVRAAIADVLDNYQPQRAGVLDPRVAYVITAMMEGVINAGTAAGVRGRGFTAPAAGKTGSSHDAWFAGYTSNLLCIVWVGYDDYSDIHLTGGALALPIWTEVMKRAVLLPEFSDVKPFTPPQGVVRLTLDKNTNQVATPACPDDYTTAFIDGTQPTQTCDQSDRGNIFQRVLGLEPKPAPPVSNAPTSSGQSP